MHKKGLKHNTKVVFFLQFVNVTFLIFTTRSWIQELPESTCCTGTVYPLHSCERGQTYRAIWSYYCNEILKCDGMSETRMDGTTDIGDDQNGYLQSGTKATVEELIYEVKQQT